MDIEIRQYSAAMESDVIRIMNEENWDEYTGSKEGFYREILENSVAYCAYAQKTCCGFIRALQDKGIAVYIMDLLVVKNFRNNGIGEKLLKKMKAEFPDLHVYVLSDEDKYYEKKGLVKVGSVFEIIR